MNKKLALGIGLSGAALLTLSLTVFGVGAAATLNHADSNRPGTRAAESELIPSAAVVPANAMIPAPTETATMSETSEAESIEPPDIVNPLLSDASTAMTPDEQANGREWMKTLGQPPDSPSTVTPEPAPTTTGTTLGAGATPST